MRTLLLLSILMDDDNIINDGSLRAANAMDSFLKYLENRIFLLYSIFLLCIFFNCVSLTCHIHFGFYFIVSL